MRLRDHVLRWLNGGHPGGPTIPNWKIQAYFTTLGWEARIDELKERVAKLERVVMAADDVFSVDGSGGLFSALRLHDAREAYRRERAGIGTLPKVAS